MRRRGSAGVLHAIRPGQEFRNDVRRLISGSDIEQRADQVSHHCAQKSVCRHHEIESFAGNRADLQPLQSSNRRRARASAGFRKSAKITCSRQFRRCAAHRRKIQSPPKVKAVTPPDCRPGLSTRHHVNVRARLRRKPRMEPCVHLPGACHGKVRRKISVQRHCHALGRDSSRRLERHDLSERMHSCIRPSGRMKYDRVIDYPRDRFAEHQLDCPLIVPL